MRTLDRELPDTAAAMRLSGLEMADAIEEVSLLGCASSCASQRLFACCSETGSAASMAPCACL